ncbi:Dihydroxyacetone kinase 1 [Smittium mucronatum]|uniref:Dihydroxyacetone kinase 1 n=1 Tax=Smittium mucronatum TaxID=133383 RepID=A0A1R0H5M1_9FUNG|nr:Dihydroxyacetone kinase 1 [Smittium mucronatum]
MLTEKHFVNDPNELVLDSLKGFVATSPHVNLDEENKVVYMKNIDQLKEDQVTLFCGGGAGHEPAHAGFVGPGFLSAAVSGHIFASPSSSQVLSCLKRIYSPKHGTVVIVKNYTGDILNFGRAIERFKAFQASKNITGTKVAMVVVGDDVGVVNENEEVDVGRRGLSGTIFVHKIASSAAANGHTFEYVEKIANYVANNVFTIGSALSPSSIPGSGMPRILGNDQVEFGMGIHNEPGFKIIKLGSAKEMVSLMVDVVIGSKLFIKSSDSSNKSKKVHLLVNNLGALSNLELGLVSKEAIERISSSGYEIVRPFQGTFMTGLAMPGISLSLLVDPLDGSEFDLSKFIDFSSHAPGWINHISVPNCSTQSDLFANDNKFVGANLDSVPSSPNREMWIRIIDSIYSTCKEQEPEITRLDTVMGDGDCGSVLMSGVESVHTAIHNDKIPIDDIASAISSVSSFLESSMGGTSGAIYCLFFDGVSQSLASHGNKTPTNQQWAIAVKAGLDTIQRYSTARAGDRTMIDAIQPFSESLNGAHFNISEALEAAKQGAEKTVEMQPKRGRAVYTGKGKGVADAGAVGVCAIIEGLAKALA